jgi:tape measure domain-containing protein
MGTEVGSLNASLSLDISSFSAGLTEAIALVRSFSEQLKEALGGDFSQGFNAIQQQVVSMQESISWLQAQMEDFQAATSNVGSASNFAEMETFTGRIGDDILKASDATEELAQSFDNATQGARATDNATKRVGNSAGQAAGKSNNLANGLKNTASQAERAASSTRSLATSIGNIVTGIMISQGFYRVLNTVQDLVGGSAQFMVNMSQAQIAYTHMLGSAANAQSMIRSMQDFAVTSPLDTQSTMNASRQLMAMGFSAKSVIPTLRTLADTASVFASSEGGIDDMISRLTLAIGQIKASGTMMGQEMRQLYNAGIPVFQIFQEELGLTSKQIRNIGKQGISANVAISALLKGLSKRYSGAAKEFTQTIPGAWATIKDSLSILFDSAFQAPYQALSKWINRISLEIQGLAQITRMYGTGGLLTAIFTPELMPAIRNIVGSFEQLGMAMQFIGRIAGEVFSTMGGMIVQVMSYILPPISILINFLAQTAYWLVANVPGLKQVLALMAGYTLVLILAKAFMLLWNVLKLGAICSWLGTQFVNLWKAISSATVFFAANKWALAIALVVAALAALVLTSERARASLSKLFGAFSQGADKTVVPNLNIGFNPNKILQPTFKQSLPDANKYNDTLADVADNLNNIGNNADKTKKKLKDTFNQSFDEVYSIDEKKDAADTLGLSNLGDLSGALDGIQNQLDDLSASGDFTKDWGDLVGKLGLDKVDTTGFDPKEFANTFWQQLVQAFNAPEWVGAGIGGAIGAVFGTIIGGPGGTLIGAAIGALVGYVAGLFWPEIKKALGLSDAQGIGISIGAGIGGAIGMVIGGPGGAAIGAAIGGLVGDIGSLLYDGFVNNHWNYQQLGLSIGTAIGAAIGFIIGGPAGALIGAAIGTLVGNVGGLIVKGFQTGDWDYKDMSLSIGTVLGTAIGFLAGGPLGAAIGAAVGILCGDVIGQIAEGFTTGNWDLQSMAIPLGTLIGGAIGLIAFGPAGALIGAGIGALVGWIGQQLSEHWGDIQQNVDELGKNIGKGFDDAKTNVQNTWQGVEDWWQTNVWIPIGQSADGVKNQIGDSFNTAKNNIQTAWQPVKDWWQTNVWTPLSDDVVSAENIAVGAWTEGKDSIETAWAPVEQWWQDNVWTPLNQGADSAKQQIQQDFSDAQTNVQTAWQGTQSWWQTNVWDPLNAKATDTKNQLEKNFNEAKTGVQSAWQTTQTWWQTNVWTPLNNKASDTKNWLGAKFDEAKNSVQASWQGTQAWWQSNVWTPINDKAADAKTWLSSKFTEAWGDVTKTWSDVQTWWSKNVWDPWKNGWNSVFGWFDDRVNDIKNALASLADLGSKVTGKKTSKGSSSVLDGYKNGGIVGDISDARIVGHATGGIFNREHVARFAEGNKSEAIIPLQNEDAMYPFVDAIAGRLADVLANNGSQDEEITYNSNSSGTQPIILQVGTLIADEVSLKKLGRKLKIINKSENVRLLGQGG